MHDAWHLLLDERLALMHGWCMMLGFGGLGATGRSFSRRAHADWLINRTGLDAPFAAGTITIILHDYLTRCYTVYLVPSS